MLYYSTAINFQEVSRPVGMARYYGLNRLKTKYTVPLSAGWLETKLQVSAQLHMELVPKHLSFRYSCLQSHEEIWELKGWKSGNLLRNTRRCKKDCSSRRCYIRLFNEQRISLSRAVRSSTFCLNLFQNQIHIYFSSPHIFSKGIFMLKVEIKEK